MLQYYVILKKIYHSDRLILWGNENLINMRSQIKKSDHFLFSKYIWLLVFIISFTNILKAQVICPTQPPSLGVNTGTYKIVCDLPGTIEFYITGYETIENDFASYYIDYGDERSTNIVQYGDEIFYYKDKFTNDQIRKKHGKIEYEYNQSYCEYNKKEWKIEVRAIIDCDPNLRQRGSTSLMLQRKGIIDFNPLPKCNYIGCFQNKSEGFINSKCEETKYYYWDFGDNTYLQQFEENPDMNPCHEYKCPGIYDVTLYAYASVKLTGQNGKYVYVGDSCGGDSLTKQITILPLPKLKKVEDINVCKGQKVSELFLPALDTCFYDWYNPSTGKCESTDVCAILGDGENPKNVAQKFIYTVSGDYIGLSKGEHVISVDTQEEKKVIPSFKAVNETTEPLTAVVCIRPFNETDCEGESICYKITVNPEAKMDNLLPRAFCHNDEAKVPAFKASVSDVTFAWNVKEGDWSAIGMPRNEGEGSIPQFTAKNETKDPITVTIEVQANSEMCNGSKDEFTITVYPYPTYQTNYKDPTTCGGSDGWIEFTGLNLNTTQYKIQYQKNNQNPISNTYNSNNGTIKITGLSKGTYSNIGIAAFGSNCYTKTNDITLVDPPLPNIPVISSNSPVCIGSSLELKVNEADNDIQTWEWEGSKCDGVTWTSNLKEPTRANMEYCMAGPYKLTVERNKCTASSTIEISYREDPEVTLLPLKSICVGTFAINEEVTYNWKTIPVGQQKIKWEVIDSEGSVIQTATVAKPTFTINNPGEYLVKVSVEGFECNGDKLVAEQPLKVKDINYTLDITPDKETTLCVNEEITFVNNTTKTEGIKYKWSVSPSTITYTNGTNDTSEVPHIQFKEIGDYTITVTSDNECAQKSKVFNVRVHQTPSVLLNGDLEACTNVPKTISNEEVSYVWNNVELKQPTWSVTPEDEVTISDKNALLPTFTFASAGNYTIRVEVSDVGCGGIRYSEKTISVYEAGFDLKVENQDVTICENKEVAIDNKTGDNQGVSYEWTVTDAQGNLAESVEYVSGVSSSTSPVFKFTRYGDYTVRVVAKNVCTIQEYSFHVSVKKDPEVTFETLGEVCTTQSYVFTDANVHYTWNSVKESERSVTWSVLDSEGNVVPTTDYTINDVHALYPSIVFSKSGTYTIKVDVVGQKCSEETVSESGQLIVYDNEFTLSLEAINTTICEGDAVSFKNETQASEILKYTWSVVPNTGFNEFATDATAPSITFTEYGSYTVTALVESNCSTEEVSFDIVVRKDPEVVVDPIADFCTNTNLTLDDRFVHYTWYNALDADKRASWRVVEGDDSAVTLSDVNVLYPMVSFSKPGSYKLEVEIPNYDCHGAKSKATAMFTILDAEFDLKVENQDITICYGQAIPIVNNTDDTHKVSYNWSVTDKDGNSIDGWEFESGNVTDKFPVFKFIEPNNYVVTVKAENICSLKTYSFTVRVNKDPEIQFKDVETICNNTTITMDEAKVEYIWYNMLDSEKEIEWSITPTTGVTSEALDSEKPSFTFTDTGDYTLSVKVKAIGCFQTFVEKSIDITVISDNLDLQVAPDKLEGCVPLDVTFSNTTSDTDEITYKWTVDKPASQWVFKQGSETDKSPIFTFNQEDLYKVSLEVQNKCNSKFVDFEVQTYDEVHITLDKLPLVCGEYTFDSNSETEGLHITGNTNNIKSINWVVYKSIDNTGANYQLAPSESYEYEVGDANILYPIIKLKQSGLYKIELQTQTICNDETVSTSIEIEEPIVITLTQPEPLCANIPDEYGQNPYALGADPTDGRWSWENAVPAEQQEYLDATNKLFYPNKPGKYSLKYEVQRQACNAKEVLEITVKDYPVMDIGADIFVCEKDQTPILLEGVPNDGVWMGNGVSLDGSAYYFNPPLEVGDYTLIYTITDAFGCKNRDAKQAHIQPLPNADFGPVHHCLPDPIEFTPMVDVAEHQFELDYGDGEKGNSLTHLYENIGIYDVKLIVTAPSGCVDSLTKSVLVEQFPNQEIKIDERTGCSPFTPTIELDYDYIDPNTTFVWDFGMYGNQYTEQPSAVTFEAVGNDTTYFFTVTVKNVCGEYTVKDSVRVLALPKAGILPNIERGCSPVEVEFKNVSVGSIQRMQYTWDFGDGSPRENGFQASHTFTTTMQKDATYTVMLIAENACGVDTTYQEIYVIPPVVFPQIVAKNQTGCVGEDICVLNRTMEVEPHHEIITYHWDYDNGAFSDNPTDTCTVFYQPGEYTIKLTITTSCGSSETDEAKVRIYDVPKFNISAVDYICRKDTVSPHIEVLSDIREVRWEFGTGDSSKVFNPKYSYSSAGEYTITAIATENNFAECKASKSIPLLVRELPNPLITPLEADSCSPFTYAPIIYDDEIDYEIDYLSDGFRRANRQYTYVNTGLEPTIYQTKIYLQDKYGCKSERHGVITVYPEPIASITIAEVIEARPEVVTFANTSYGANYCKWILPYRGITETCEDVKEYYYDNTLQTTYLEVANEHGCTDKDSVDHQPMMKGLYFPNTFAPNGVTEEIRTFNGVGIGLKTYRLEVFDLYGNLIFYTTSLDENGSPNKGWDGRDQYGNMMPQDVYTWKAEAVFLDGSVYTFGNDYDNIPGTEVNDVNLHRGSVLLLHR